MSEIVYTLKNPIDYTNKGEVEKASFVTLVSPSYKQLEHMTPIKQAFMIAVTDFSDSVDISSELIDEIKQSKEESEDSGLDGIQVLQAMYGSPKCEMNKIVIYAKSLFISGVALLEGEKPFTAPLIDKLSADDFEGLLGCYIANFIAPSLMGGM